VQDAPRLPGYAKTLGELRDAVLVLVSVAYLLGFLSWAFYAARNDLGLVRALDAQYLVAGVLPAIVVALGIALAMLHLRFSRWSAAEPSPARFKWATGLVTAGILIAGISFLIAFLTGKDLVGGGIVVGSYVLMAGALLQGSKGIALFRYYALGVVWLIVAFIPLILFLAYTERVFPYLPAALGGPAPRCVVVDLATQDLSAHTRSSLLARDSDDAGNVRQTRAVNLVFDGPEFIMLRVKDHGATGPVYAVAKRAVLALAPCPP
jgi:hypothetical protein